MLKIPKPLFVLLLVIFGSLGQNLVSAQISDSVPSTISSRDFIIRKINLKGNKVTKDYILLRELEVSPGDTLTGTRLNLFLADSRKNLLNTSLFNFVTLDLDTTNIKNFTLVDLTVDVIERWYIWPFPIFEFADRNFNAWLKDKDLRKVNYGGYLVWDNFRGRKESLTMLLRFGYDEKYQLFYEKPYINKKRTLGMGFGLAYNQSHEVAIKTVNDTLNFFKLKNGYPSKEYRAYVQLSFRPNIHNTHTLQFGYHNFQFQDTLFKLNPDYSNGQLNRVRFFSLKFKFKSDYRDFVAYPLHGYYFDFLIEKYGLGLVSGNQINNLFVQSTIRKYWQLSGRLYFASVLTAQFSNDHHIPYYLRQGLGYGRLFVRAYEYYVAEGQKFGLSRSNLKFAIIPTKVFSLNFIPLKQFSKIHFAMYLNAFWDMGYVDNKYNLPNELTNSLLHSYGLGLDLVTYYDIVFRMEISTNRMNETGFFIHFMAPI
jgi:outer membrane protein assembly factor BamA